MPSGQSRLAPEPDGVDGPIVLPGRSKQAVIGRHGHGRPEELQTSNSFFLFLIAAAPESVEMRRGNNGGKRATLVLPVTTGVTSH